MKRSHALGVVSALALSSALGCAKNIPIPDVKVSADEAQLARGKYLADVMGCVGCHSLRDWSKLGGPVIDGTQLGGSGDIGKEEGFPDSFSFGGPNLTPHHLKDWSDGEIVRAFLEGQTKDRKGLFPLMPYIVWRETVALDDAAALVAYLRTVPSIEHDSPPRSFPIPGFVLDSMPEPRELKQKAPKPGDPAFPAYVVARSACFDCHTNADDRGIPIGVPFAGGREFKVPAPGKGFLHAANLTPDEETGLGKWTKEQFIGKFKSATLEQARATPVGDDGYNTMMPWWAYSNLTEEDLGGIWDFLHALPPTKNKVEKHTPTSSTPAK